MEGNNSGNSSKRLDESSKSLEAVEIATDADILVQNEEIQCYANESKQCIENFEPISNIINTADNTEIILDTPAKTTNSSKDEKILIDINFRNKKIYFALHEDFIGIIKKYYKEKIDDLDFCDDASNNRICISEKRVKKSDSFLVDTELNKDSNESTPRYNTFTKIILSNTKSDPDVEKNVKTSSSNKCFNCDKGTHSLRDCPEPKNQTKIRRARNEFNKKEFRYHDDKNDEYSSLIPGQISDDLKNALGLTDNQLPLHVYKMRKFGYPIAWLEEAKVAHSELNVLDSKVISLDHTDEMKQKIDVQKIYEFPGFNVNPPIPFVDKHRLYNLPPMLPQHSKENFIISLGDCIINGYKKRKITSIDNYKDTSTNVEEAEMEIEDAGLVVDERIESPNKPTNIDDSSEEGELSENSADSSNFENPQNGHSNHLTQLSEISFQNTNKIANNIPSTEGNQQDIGIVETTIFGCPVLPSFSHYEGLPGGDKFQDGVCDVIAFENLAESTGKYEKMKEILKKVRNFQKEHMSE